MVVISNFWRVSGGEQTVWDRSAVGTVLVLSRAWHSKALGLRTFDELVLRAPVDGVVDQTRASGGYRARARRAAAIEAFGELSGLSFLRPDNSLRQRAELDGDQASRFSLTPQLPCGTMTPR
jgi:hypothetical protein